MTAAASKRDSSRDRRRNSSSSASVRDAWPERFAPMHIRTPHYLRGREGVVARHLGTFAAANVLENDHSLAVVQPFFIMGGHIALLLL